MDTPETIVSARVSPALPAEVDLLASEMRRRFGEAVAAVIFYGSCLRRGDVRAGVVDLYVIVDSYARAYSGWTERALAGFLPPTVGYLELPDSDGTIRAKYAVISARDFRRGTSGTWFHPYLWGRFAQPCALAYVRGSSEKQAVAACVASAARTLLRRTLPLVTSPTGAAELWTRALELSYGTELRPESGNRSGQLVAENADYYRALTETLAPQLGLRPVYPGGSGEPAYLPKVSPWRRRRTAAAWAIRRVTGKLLSPVRWLKALATFEGGLDYAAWKLERHSGVAIQIPDKVRRRPWLHVWGELWRLYRRGVLR